MDTYADDLAKLVEALSLKDASRRHSPGGEVARYIAQRTVRNVLPSVLIGAVPR